MDSRSTPSANFVFLLETAGWVGDADVDFAIEAAEAAECGVDGVGPVGRGHDHDIAARLHSVHQGQELGDNPSFDFSVGLVSLGSDFICLIDKDDCGRLLFRLFEGFPQIGLGLAGHLTHDFRSVRGRKKKAPISLATARLSESY